MQTGLIILNFRSFFVTAIVNSISAGCVCKLLSKLSHLFHKSFLHFWLVIFSHLLMIFTLLWTLGGKIHLFISGQIISLRDKCRTKLTFRLRLVKSKIGNAAVYSLLIRTQAALVTKVTYTLILLRILSLKWYRCIPRLVVHAGVEVELPLFELHWWLFRCKLFAILFC